MYGLAGWGHTSGLVLEGKVAGSIRTGKAGSSKRQPKEKGKGRGSKK